jgi:hypothetical protein
MEQIWGRREPFLEKRFGVDKTWDMGVGSHGGSEPIIYCCVNSGNAR